MIPLTLAQVAEAVDGSFSSRDRAVTVRRVTTDSRVASPGDLFVALVGPRFDGHEFIADAVARGAAAVLCRPSVNPDTRGRPAVPPIPMIIVQDTGAALIKLAAYYRGEVMRRDTVVIAVTGSNGKTTTKALIDHVLRGSLKGRAAPKSFNNAIGVPLTLLSCEWDDAYVVVEIGTNAPGEVAALASVASPGVAVISSIGEAHLEGLGDIHGVAAEKCALLRHVRPDGLAVVNIDRAEIRPHLRGSVRSALVTFGFDPVADLQVDEAVAELTRTSFRLDGRYRVDLPIPGAHHATNAAAAYVVARRFGLPAEQVVGRFPSFIPVDGRCQVLEIAGIQVVDDSYNANPASVAAAIAALAERHGRRVLVMGDMRELGSGSADLHRRVVDAVLSAEIEVLVTVGEESGAAAAACLRGANARGSSATRWIAAAAAEAAADALVGLLRPGDIVWIKGSRALRLDRVVECLRGRFCGTAAVA